MALQGKAVQRIVVMGMKYAPLAYEGFKRTRGPAQEMAQRQLARRNARGAALEHAQHLVDGSVLPVYDGDTKVWVVFSGDTPVGSHPVVRTPLEQLLRHYDLAKRERPSEGQGARPAGRAAGLDRLRRRSQ